MLAVAALALGCRDTSWLTSPVMNQMGESVCASCGQRFTTSDMVAYWQQLDLRRL